MTGRELIIYILENHLEEIDISKCFDENVNDLGVVLIEDAAVDCGVGKATLITWCARDYLDFITINGKTYILKNKKYEDVKSWEEI